MGNYHIAIMAFMFCSLPAAAIVINIIMRQRKKRKQQKERESKLNEAGVKTGAISGVNKSEHFDLLPNDISLFPGFPGSSENTLPNNGENQTPDIIRRHWDDIGGPGSDISDIGNDTHFGGGGGFSGGGAGGDYGSSDSGSSGYGSSDSGSSDSSSSWD